MPHLTVCWRLPKADGCCKPKSQQWSKGGRGRGSADAWKAKQRITVQAFERETDNKMNAEGQSGQSTRHGTRSDFQMVRRGLRQGWKIPPEQWEKAAAEGVEVLLDPATSRQHKLGAVRLFLDAAVFSEFDVDETLKRLMGRGQIQSERQYSLPNTGEPTDGT